MENEMMEMVNTEEVIESVEFNETPNVPEFNPTTPESEEKNGLGALLAVGILAAGGAAIYAGKKWILPKLKKAKENHAKKRAEKFRKGFIECKAKGFYDSYESMESTDVEKRPVKESVVKKTTKTTRKKTKKSETTNDD